MNARPCTAPEGAAQALPGIDPAATSTSQVSAAPPIPCLGPDRPQALENVGRLRGH